jgi:hypothetical protein
VRLVLEHTTFPLHDDLYLKGVRFGLRDEARTAEKLYRLVTSLGTAGPATVLGTVYPQLCSASVASPHPETIDTPRAGELQILLY